MTSVHNTGGPKVAYPTYFKVSLGTLQLEALSLTSQLCLSQPHYHQIRLEKQPGNLTSQLHNILPTTSGSTDIRNNLFGYHYQRYHTTSLPVKGRLTNQHCDTIHELLNRPDLLLSESRRASRWIFHTRANYEEKMIADSTVNRTRSARL